MVSAKDDGRAAANGSGIDVAQLEAHEVHGGGLFFRGPLEVFVGNGVAALALPHAHVDLIFHPHEAPEGGPALGHVAIFEHEGGFPVLSIGDEGVIGLDLFHDAIHFEDALDAKHLLHLVLHGEKVLEVESGIRR